jgi:hypothetical protein
MHNSGQSVQNSGSAPIPAPCYRKGLDNPFSSAGLGSIAAMEVLQMLIKAGNDQTELETETAQARANETESSANATISLYNHQADQTMEDATKTYGQIASDATNVIGGAGNVGLNIHAESFVSKMQTLSETAPTIPRNNSVTTVGDGLPVGFAAKTPTDQAAYKSFKTKLLSVTDGSNGRGLSEDEYRDLAKRIPKGKTLLDAPLSPESGAQLTLKDVLESAQDENERQNICKALAKGNDNALSELTRLSSKYEAYTRMIIPATGSGISNGIGGAAQSNASINIQEQGEDNAEKTNADQQLQLSGETQNSQEKVRSQYATMADQEMQMLAQMWRTDSAV